MLSAFWSKCWGWICALGVLIAAFGSAYLAGMRKGKDGQQAKVDQATEEAQSANQAAQAVETRHDVDTEVSQLPQAPAQDVATSNSSSAAGKLRDDWMRP